MNNITEIKIFPKGNFSKFVHFGVGLKYYHKGLRFYYLTHCKKFARSTNSVNKLNIVRPATQKKNAKNVKDIYWSRYEV